MVLAAKRLGLGALAADLAALLSERDILKRADDADIRLRLEALRGPGDHNVDRGGVQRCREAARRIRRQLKLAPADDSVEDAGLLLAFAYPDRLAQRRGGDALHYRMSNGRGAFLAQPEALAVADVLAIAELDGARRDARIFPAAPLSLADIENHFAPRITTSETVRWDAREQAVTLAGRDQPARPLEPPGPDGDSRSPVAVGSQEAP
jgi:ATP-dependent helicase HrpB